MKVRYLVPRYKYYQQAQKLPGDNAINISDVLTDKKGWDFYVTSILGSPFGMHRTIFPVVHFCFRHTFNKGKLAVDSSQQ